MLYQQSRSAYQTAAASGATQAGLLQLVYTRLAQDLLQAADAIRKDDIEGRCAASKHALLLLGHLESWVSDVKDHALAESLRAFYAMLRTAVLAQQAALDHARLEQCAQLVLDTRAAWQAKEEDALSSSHGTIPGAYTEPERISFQA